MEKLTRTIHIMDACTAAFLLTIGKRCFGTDNEGFEFDESCREDVRRYHEGATVPALEFARESSRCIKLAKDLRDRRRLVKRILESRHETAQSILSGTASI
jgi:hypothetical protein